MKRVLLPLMVVLATGCPTENPTGTPSTRVDDILALTGDSANGDTIYASACASCHAADGTGGVGPSLVAEFPSTTDEEVLTIVINGEGGMPGNAVLDDQELADLLAYLTEQFGA